MVLGKIWGRGKVFNNVSLAFLHGRFGEDWKGLGKVLAGIWEDFESNRDLRTNKWHTLALVSLE